MPSLKSALDVALICALMIVYVSALTALTVGRLGREVLRQMSEAVVEAASRSHSTGGAGRVPGGRSED